MTGITILVLVPDADARMFQEDQVDVADLQLLQDLSCSVCLIILGHIKLYSHISHFETSRCSRWMNPFLVEELETKSVNSKTLLIMTPSNGNILRVTGPLWGETTDYRWIPFTKTSDADLSGFRWSTPEQTVEQTIGTPVIWDAIALIMTSCEALETQRALRHHQVMFTRCTQYVPCHDFRYQSIYVYRFKIAIIILLSPTKCVPLVFMLLISNQLTCFVELCMNIKAVGVDIIKLITLCISVSNPIVVHLFKATTNARQETTSVLWIWVNALPELKIWTICSCINHARQTREIYQVLPYSVNIQSPGELCN